MNQLLDPDYEINKIRINLNGQVYRNEEDRLIVRQLLLKRWNLFTLNRIDLIAAESLKFSS